MDQMLGYYTVKYKSRRWHVVVFCNILDIACLNAYILHKCEFPLWNSGKSNCRCNFLVELGKGLIAYNQPPVATIPPVVCRTVGPSRGRCHICDRDTDRKYGTKCSACAKFVCKEHSVSSVVCTRCL